MRRVRRRMWLGAVSAALVVLGPACATSSGGADDARDAEATLEDDGAGEIPTDGPGTCLGDRDCDDRIACTIDHCADGTCSHEPCSDCCPEGLQCLVGLGCGPAPTPCTADGECGDDVRCTLDRCRDATFCEYLPQDGLCEDGEICLAAIGCIPRPPESCVTPDDCLPGRPCLGVWYCDPEFGCQFESLLDCDDDDACTADSCDDAEGGCVHTPVDVDDDGFVGEACDGDDCDDGDGRGLRLRPRGGGHLLHHLQLDRLAALRARLHVERPRRPPRRATAWTTTAIRRATTGSPAVPGARRPAAPWATSPARQPATRAAPPGTRPAAATAATGGSTRPRSAMAGRWAATTAPRWPAGSPAAPCAARRPAPSTRRRAPRRASIRAGSTSSARHRPTAAPTGS